MAGIALLLPEEEMCQQAEAVIHHKDHHVIYIKQTKIDNSELCKKVTLNAKTANSHFLRTAGPHFPDSQGHIKRTVQGNSRAGVSRPC